MSVTATAKPAPASPIDRGWAWWLPMIGLIWLAVFLRLHQLDQTPPGLYHDEAFYTLDAQHLLEYGRWLIFYPGNNGREPLHVYLLAGAQWLLGDRTWAVRLVSAFSGTLAVPLIYCLGRALWRGAGQRSRWVGLLAAGSLAVSYWDVNFSRTAFRNIHLVAVSILAVWLLWRGAQQRSRRLIVLSGVALGVSLYIYLAARVFPAVFLGLALALVLIGWRFGGQPLRAALRQPLATGSLAALAVAAVVCLPLGVYFALHPDQFSERSGGLSVLSPAPAAPPASGVSEPPTLAGNIVATVRMFVDRGDANARHNLPGRPAVDWVGQIGLLAGLGLALWQLRQPRSVLLLGWLVTMLLPTTLSVEAPHFLRAIGALPPLCLLVAGGLAALWQPVMAAQPKLAAAGWPALLIGVVAISGSLTYRDYFLRWAPAPATADAFDIGIYTVSQRALALSQTDDVVLPLKLFTEPVARVTLEPVFRHLVRLDAAVGTPRPAVLLVSPGADLTTLVLLRRLPGQPAQALVLPTLDTQAARELAQQPSSGTIADVLGRPLATEVRGIERWLPAPAPAQQPLDATLGGLVQLAGADVRPAAPNRGDPLQIDLHWNSLKWLPEDDLVFMQLQTPAGDNLEQLDSQPMHGSYATTLWAPGNYITDPYTLTVPSDLAPGTYRIIAGLHRPNGQRLPVTGTHDVLADSVVVGHLYLPDPALNLGAITHQTTITGGEPASLKLVGYDLAANTLAAGSSLSLTLYWQDLAPLAVDYTVFVHLTDSAGQVRAQADAQPLGGRAPTSWWRPGELFRDPRTVTLGRDLPPGSYSLSVGLYDLATGERLPLLDASGQRLSDDQALLGSLTVTGPQP